MEKGGDLRGRKMGPRENASHVGEGGRMRTAGRQDGKAIREVTDSCTILYLCCFTCRGQGRAALQARGSGVFSGRHERREHGCKIQIFYPVFAAVLYSECIQNHPTRMGIRTHLFVAGVASMSGKLEWQAYHDSSLSEEE